MPRIWKSDTERRGLKLLVEKDFKLQGFIINNDARSLPPHRLLNTTALYPMQ